jgi:hypothetical protein
MNSTTNKIARAQSIFRLTRCSSDDELARQSMQRWSGLRREIPRLFTAGSRRIRLMADGDVVEFRFNV